MTLPPLRHDQLDPYLQQPFCVAGSQADHGWPLPTLDVRLAQSVATSVNRSENVVLVVPYVSTWSLAFLARSLSVATVGRPPITLYSPDRELTSRYRLLTTPSGEPLWHAWPLVPVTRHPHTPGFVGLARAVAELESVTAEGPLIADGRLLRTSAAAERFLKAASGISGPKAIIVPANYHPSIPFFTSKGFSIQYAPFLGDPAERSGLPLSVAPYFERLAAYAAGVRVIPHRVRKGCAPLQRLEEAHQALARAAAGQGTAWPPFLYHADQFNHIVQASLLPLSIVADSARDLERLWLDSHLRALELSLDQECPARLATKLRDFLSAGIDVLEYLRAAHPPKVEWLLERMREHGDAETLRIYCRTEMERSALSSFQAGSGEVGRLNLQGVPKTSLREGSLGHGLLVPSPPNRGEISLLLSGVTPAVVILMYSWEAPRWNAFLRRASHLLRPELLPEFDRQEPTYEDPDEDRLLLAPSANLEHDEGVLRAVIGKKGITDRMAIPTDHGYREYHSGALIPTLYEGKFVDLPLDRIKPGDTIMVRSDGYPVDSRSHVDGLARTNPIFAEAADLASVWWVLFVKFASDYLPRNGGQLSKLYDVLFPDKEVTYPTFSNWFLGEIRAEEGGNPVKLIGPIHANLERLLSRMGLPPPAIHRIQTDLSTYRGMRRKAYNYLSRRCREHASKLVELSHGDEVETQSVGRTVDTEMGLLLSSLDDLIQFAKVTGPPFRRLS